MRIGVGLWSLFVGLVQVFSQAHAAISIERLQVDGGHALLMLGYSTPRKKSYCVRDRPLNG